MQNAPFRLIAALWAIGFIAHSAAAAAEFPLDQRRIVFLGDSITHAGHYIARIEAQLRAAGVEPLPELINLGLPSETASGLSEEGHPFPRPSIHERLDRALSKSRPDVVVVCYGMNDGIYHPQSEERFAAYRDGINRVIEKAHAAGAKVILMTPPPFDPEPLRPKGKLKPRDADGFGFGTVYEDYDDVLADYARWVLAQQERVAMTIDIRTPLVEAVQAKRREDPGFTFTPDGIHPTQEGHRIIADAILKAWGVAPTDEIPERALQLTARRQQIVHNAWLSEVGHQRPGMQPGLPLDQAQREAAEIERQLQE